MCAHHFQLVSTGPRQGEARCTLCPIRLVPTHWLAIADKPLHGFTASAKPK